MSRSSIAPRVVLGRGTTPDPRVQQGNAVQRNEAFATYIPVFAWSSPRPPGKCQFGAPPQIVPPIVPPVWPHMGYRAHAHVRACHTASTACSACSRTRPQGHGRMAETHATEPEREARGKGKGGVGHDAR